MTAEVPAHFGNAWASPPERRKPPCHHHRQFCLVDSPPLLSDFADIFTLLVILSAGVWMDRSISGREQSLLNYISTALLLFQALRHNHSWERRVSDFVAQYPLFMPAGLRFKRFLIKGSLINNRSCFPAVYVYPVYVWRENSKTEKSRKG